MSVTLFVGPLIDPEETNQQEIMRLQAILSDLNEQLAERGLPEYHELKALPEGHAFWNAIFSNQWLVNLHAFLDNLREDANAQLDLSHFVDPTAIGVHYFPVDFPEPLVSILDDEMVYASCPRLLAEIEDVAQLLGIPLERFPIDFSGDGDEMGKSWTAVFNELDEQEAPCTRLSWAQSDMEGVLEQIHNFCEMTGTPEDDFKQSLINEHGSLEDYVESLNEDTPSDEENNMGLVFTLVNYYHGCKYAIENGLTFGMG